MFTIWTKLQSITGEVSQEYQDWYFQWFTRQAKDSGTYYGARGVAFAGRIIPRHTFRRI